MKVSTIVAAAHNRVIGKNNDIPWYLPNDLKYFKKTTTNHHVIMGRKCFESIGRPLPNRVNIVVTRQPFFIASGIVVAHSIEEALSIAKENGEEEAFVIGGGEIYKASYEFWDRIYYTNVDLEVEGDVLFPEFPDKDWLKISSVEGSLDEKNTIPHSFEVFIRKGFDN